MTFVGDMLENEGDLEYRGVLFPVTGDTYQRFAWDLESSPDPAINDTTLQDRTMPGNDGAAGVHCTATYTVTPGDDAVANVDFLRALMAPSGFSDGIAWMKAGQKRVRFGRARKAKPDWQTFRFPTVLDFLATDPTFYGLELNPGAFTTTITVAAGGNCPTNQWSLNIAGPCSGPTIAYPTPVGGVDVVMEVAYEAVPSGNTLRICGWFNDVARAFLDDGAGGRTVVNGTEVVTGKVHQLGPVTQNSRTFTSTQPATLLLRNGFVS